MSGSDAVSITPGAVMSKLPVTADTKGRLRATKEQRRVILAKFEQSGLSAVQFAQRTGLKYSTFAAWVQRYRRVKRPERKPAMRLLEAVVAPTAPPPGLQVQLPDGARLEISDASQIPLAAALVRAMEKPC
jgi:DNA-binding transcriptional regulator YiaG